MPKVNPFIPSALALAMMAAQQTHAAETVLSGLKLDTLEIQSSQIQSQQTEKPASVSTLSEETLEQPQVEHIEDILAQTPNVNASAGSSRGKFYQIRGVGERDQFSDVLNPSVGVVVDGIDMSAMAGAATLMDAQQVEVLRGPQGGGQGSSALAGLIMVKAKEPTKERESYIETTLGTYNTRNVTAVTSGPASDKVGYRIAVQRNLSDGYISNDYLGKDNTNNIDETLLRTKFAVEANEDLDLGFTVFYADIDNGYDAFVLDNTRHSLANQPGHDRQETLSLSANSSWYGNPNFTLETAINLNKSNLEYGYDADWVYPAFYPDPNQKANKLNAGSETDNYVRDEKGATADIRLLSTPDSALHNGKTDWSTGVYFYTRTSDLTRTHTYAGYPLSSTSDYQTNRFATYGELDSTLTDTLRLTTSLRAEYNRFSYKDSRGNQGRPEDLLWGTKVALEYQATPDQMFYGSIARGYKQGGFNSSSDLDDTPELQTYAPESLWNYEIGSKQQHTDSLNSQVSVFYQDRKNAQIRASREVAGVTTPVTYNANADSGYSYGIEALTQWQPNNAVKLHASLGILRTQLEERDQHFDGREAAHSPDYQFALGGQFKHGPHWFSGFDVEGKDEFYFSDSHDAISKNYTLVHARIGYEQDNWRVTFWGRNLTDQDYAVRGFFFDNDHRDGKTADGATTYTQLGAPRTFGVTGRLNF